MKYKLVIFDLDGTLVNTSLGILNSIRYTQKKMNLPEITLEKMYSYISPPVTESYNRVYGLSGESLQQAVGFHKKYAMEHGYKELKLYDGIVGLLDYLRKSKVKMAVATLKDYSTSLKIFNHLNIMDKFDIIKGIDAHKPKTKAELLEECVKEAQCDKKDALLIGDSKYDAIGAEQVGIDFIGVTYGFGFKTSKELNEYKFVGIARSGEEITSLLKKL